jgi:hypothetical protein
MRTAAAAVATLALTAALAGCSGSSGGDDDRDPRADCVPQGDGTTSRAMLDDKGALPADNWVPVVKASGKYRDLLTALDAATLGLNDGDLAAIAPAEGAERMAAVDAAIAEVPEAEPGTQGPRFSLAVPPGATGKAVGAYYNFALMRLGAKADVQELDTDAAIEAVRSGSVDAAVVGLADLGSAVGAKSSGDASAQVQTVATAALADELALGATAAASSTPQVLVADTVKGARSATTLSELAKACGSATIAADDSSADAAEAVAKTYGFTVGDDPKTAIAVVSTP